jgi:hypothetical protein
VTDRIVHARNTVDRVDLVRYDRAGKWYLEPYLPGLPRQLVTLKQAVDYALWLISEDRGWVNYDKPGGQTFAARVRRATHSQ